MWRESDGFLAQTVAISSCVLISVRQQFGNSSRVCVCLSIGGKRIRRKMVEAAGAVGLNRETGEREKERLKLKRARILKQHRDGYIDDAEL